MLLILIEKSEVVIGDRKALVIGRKRLGLLQRHLVQMFGIRHLAARLGGVRVLAIGAPENILGRSAGGSPDEQKQDPRPSRFPAGHGAILTDQAIDSRSDSDFMGALTHRTVAFGNAFPALHRVPSPWEIRKAGRIDR